MSTVTEWAAGASGVLVVADRRVVELHGEILDAPHHLIDADEKAKTIATWERVIDACVAQGLDRGALLVGYGGGMVLDVAGFAAAAYLRGIDWVSVPTTLLAQVDAGHGGKTGVDHAAAKNLVGAFHPPRAVLLEPGYLSTLPEREVRGGLAEVVKHGVITRPDLLERAGRDDPATLVHDAAQVKLDIVARDPREQDERRLLNLGHTLGHAVERASGYALHHGEAVAIGLRAACRLAEAHCGFAERAAVEAALDRCGLPATAPVDPGDVRTALQHDKKRKDGRLHWVLPVALGDVRVFDDVPDALVEREIGAVGPSA